MTKQTYDIDIVCDLTDISAFKLAEAIASVKLSEAGKAYNPFMVHFCTTPYADKNEFDAIVEQNNLGSHGIVQKIESENKHLGPEKVVKLLEEIGDLGRRLRGMENVTINSNSIDEGPDFTHMAVLFCNDMGKLPERVMTSVQKAKKGQGSKKKYESAAGEIPVFDEKVFDHKYIGIETKTKHVVKYTNYILVPKSGATAKLPHPNRVRESVRVWVQNPEQLRELTQKCTPCGGELQFLLCETCGKQFGKMHRCAKCTKILVRNDGESGRDAHYHCETAKCNADALRVADMLPENRNLWGCMSCKKLVDKTTFTSSIDNMKCISCKNTEPHEHIFCVGMDFSVFTDGEKSKTGEKILREYKTAWALGAVRREELRIRAEKFNSLA